MADRKAEEGFLKKHKSKFKAIVLIEIIII